MSEALPPFQGFLDANREAVWRFLVSAVGREDADDCFQETFIAALRAYPRVRPGSNLRGWVLTIAHNKAIDAHRARGRRALPMAEPEAAKGRAAGTEAAGGRAAPADAGAGERDEQLWHAVGTLPERQRAAVVLRFVADLPHREIAAAIGCSEDAARRSLHEGITKLRKAVAG